MTCRTLRQLNSTPDLQPFTPSQSVNFSASAITGSVLKRFTWNKAGQVSTRDPSAILRSRLIVNPLKRASGSVAS
jgi:hypothetical protein